MPARTSASWYSKRDPELATKPATVSQSRPISRLSKRAEDPGPSADCHASDIRPASYLDPISHARRVVDEPNSSSHVSLRYEPGPSDPPNTTRSEEHTSELQS